MPLPSAGLLSGSSGFHPTLNTGNITPDTGMIHQEPESVLEELSNLESVSRSRKRKGEESFTRASKKKKSMDRENVDTEHVDMGEGSGEKITGKGCGEGTMKNCGGKEQSGKPTLSGRVPLLPTRLAEAGYQGEKKGVRATGRTTQTMNKRKPKGNAKKPASKGAAKMPPKKQMK